MISQIVEILNRAADGAARLVLAPIGWIPGWLSATLVGVVTGVVMLLIFKYTSNQRAIRRVRSEIKASLLTLSLFRDSVKVGLRAQGRILVCASRLTAYSIVPMAVMLVPMCLLLGQLALWYQARPLRIGEEAVVTVTLSEDAGDVLRELRLASSAAAASTIGPVRVPAKSMVCWSLRALEPGLHELSFETGQGSFRKELAIGDGFLPTSLERPASVWYDMLRHPRERPFASDSPVQSIDVAYPERESWTSGTDSWILYWFIVSLVAALAARPVLKVSI